MHLQVAHFWGCIYIGLPYLNTTLWYKFCCHILQTMSIIITTLQYINYWATYYGSFHSIVIIRKMTN